MMKLLLIAVAGLAIVGWFYPRTPTLFGGTTVATFQGGTGTTTAPAGQILYGGGTNYQSRATTTASCGGSNSCTAFVVLGSSPITITGSGSFPWTPTTYSGTTVNATSTPLWLKALTPFSLIASSTFTTYASTTQLSSSAVYFTGSTPVVGGCGTATISATSTDARGTILVTAGTPSTCNVVFATVKPDSPTCLVGDNSLTIAADVQAASTTGIRIGLGAVFSGEIRYICLQ